MSRPPTTSTQRGQGRRRGLQAVGRVRGGRRGGDPGAALSMPERKDCRVTSVDTYVVGARWCNSVLAHAHTDDGVSGVGEGTCEFQAGGRRGGDPAASAPRRRWPVGLPDREAPGRRCSATSSHAADRSSTPGSRRSKSRCGTSSASALDRPVHDLLRRAPLRAPAGLRQRLVRRRGDPGRDRASRGRGRRLAKAIAASSSIRSATQAVTRTGEGDRRGEIDLLAAVREAIGPHVDLLIDAHGRFSPATAVKVARAMEPSDIFWLEEPCDAESWGAAEVGRSTRTRLATGERCYTRYHVQALLASNDMGVLQPDRCMSADSGGEEDRGDRGRRYIPVWFHNPFGPVATAARSSSTLALPTSSCRRSFASTLRPCASTCSTSRRGRRGALRDPDGSGLGVGEFSPEAANAHPYDPDAFLPMWTENWRASF